MNRKKPLLADPAKVRAWQEKSRTPLKKSKLQAVNVERTKKKRKSYAQKLAAYRRSATYKIVEERAGGYCENKVRRVTGQMSWGSPISTNFEFRNLYGDVRCESCGPLHHHHLTYARFGGKELPTDILAVCAACHAMLESTHPTRRRSQRTGGG